MTGMAALAARGFPRLTLPAEYRLSDREVDVLTLVAEGLDDTGIGAALALSPHTAKSHMARIHGKLGTRSRGQAVAVAFRLGVLA